MPFFERLLSWLRGPKLPQLIMKLEMICRKLEWEANKLERQAKTNRTKARAQRLEGNDEAAKVYVGHYLTFKNLELEFDAYRLGIEGFIVELKKNEAMGDVSKILGSLKYVVGSIKNRIRIPELSKTMDEIQQSLKHVSETKDLTEGRMLSITGVTEISPENIQKVLDELDHEIAVETEGALPQPSTKISELEKEIRKMKESKT